MNNLKLYKCEINSKVNLLLTTQGISCGFPSPADDYFEQFIDLNDILIQDKTSTFFGRATGNSMEDANISTGDVLIIDRSLEAHNNSIALCILNGEFTVKRLLIEKNQVTLIPENKDYNPQVITDDMEFNIWGVVTYIIRKAV
jgi:DNA polymerase V